MATKKGTKMSLADFIQQEGGSDPSNALPTAPRQRDPNEPNNDARHTRAWKADRFNDGGEGSGERRRGGGFGFGGDGGDGERYNRNERRGRRDGDAPSGDAEDAGPSKADTSSQWRSSNASSDRRPRYDDRGDRGDRGERGERERDGRRDQRDREDKPMQERESRGPSEADHASDWRSSGSASSSGSRSRYDDRRSDRDRSERDRDDRRGGFDRDRRRDDRDDRDRDSSSSSRWGGRDRDDDRRSGGGRYFDRRDRDDRRDDRDFDRRSDNRFDRRGPEDRERTAQRDERPAHLRFGKGRSDGPASASATAVSNEEFPSLKERSTRQPESSAASSAAAESGDKDKAKASAASALDRLAKRKAEANKEKDREKENRNENAETEKDKEEKPEEEKTKKKSKKPVAASPLEAALKGSVLLSDIQFAESVNWLTDEKDRLDDAEQRKEIIVAVALSVIEKKLSLAAVIDSLDNSALSGVAAAFVLDVLKAILTRRDESVTLAVVKSAGQDKVLSFISGGLEKDKLDAFLAQHDLASLAPVPDLSESVSKAVKNGESAESLLKLIDSSVDRKANVSYLLPIISARFLSVLFADKAKANLAVVKEFSPLLSRVSAFDKLAKVSLVGSVVNGWFNETKAARGVLKDVLEALLSGRVVSVDTLTDWKDSKEKGTAKMKALLQIATWISELVPKREEPEDNEEGEDEEDESDLMANPNQSD